MFTTIIVQPIFNLLVLIYNLIPGHNFGLAIIIFTIVIRLLMWPLVKKQLHHAKAIRALQPELKKIKEAAKGDRRKASMLTMELYKERQINPLSSLGIVLVQAPILIGLYLGLARLIKDPNELINFSYSWLHFGWLDTLAQNIHQFDETLFGVVDLTRTAVGPKGFYWPAFIIVALSAIVQYKQSKQLMPTSKDSRNLRTILKDAGAGKQADQQEVSEAVGRGTLVLIPFFVFVVGLNFAAALPLYWLVSSFVAYLQQSRILKVDVEEAQALVASPAKTKKADKPKVETSGGIKVTYRTEKSATKAARKRKRR